MALITEQSKIASHLLQMMLSRVDGKKERKDNHRTP